MTILRPQTGAIPLPIPGPISRPYWDGCRNGVLRFQRCFDCGSATHTPAQLCASCVSTNLEWADSCGRGEIYSFTVVWRPATPEFEIPYVPVIVTMEEGWWILANLIGCEHDAAEIGQKVEVEFHAVTGGTVLPYFRPLSQ